MCVQGNRETQGRIILMHIYETEPSLFLQKIYNMKTFFFSCCFMNMKTKLPGWKSQKAFSSSSSDKSFLKNLRKCKKTCEIHPPVYLTGSKCSVYIQPGDHLFIVLLVLHSPGNSCFAAPVILLRFEELSSGSSWECADPLFIAKQNTHCSWDLNLFPPSPFSLTSLSSVRIHCLLLPQRSLLFFLFPSFSLPLSPPSNPW